MQLIASTWLQLVLVALSYVLPTCGWQETHALDFKVLPYCQQYVGQLKHDDWIRIRDTLQQIQRVSRINLDLSHVLRHKQTPASDAAERRAYESPFSVEQLSEQLQREKDALTKLREGLHATMQELQQQGMLPVTVTETVLSNCLMGRLNPHLYPDHPQVSFMLQYFRRPWMIGPIVDTLRSCSDVTSELIVNVDSPEEHQTWAELAHNTSGFVVPVFSANVHEIRAYNRMASLARGSILIIMQDDQVPPSGCKWLQDLLALFSSHPHLGALGLKIYRFNTRQDNKWTGNGREMFFKDPATGILMQFVQQVDFAPMALRRAAFKHVGGLDEGLSEAGMCGIYSDFEISTRFWVAGWQVAYYRLEGGGPDRSGQPSGTHKPETEYLCWRRQMELAGSVHHERWLGERPWHLMSEVAQLVRHTNLRHLQRLPGLPCPFSPALGGCDLSSNGTGDLSTW